VYKNHLLHTVKAKKIKKTKPVRLREPSIQDGIDADALNADWGERPGEEPGYTNLMSDEG
jgi:hypothetical protein